MTLHVKLVTGPPSWYSEVTTAVRLQSWSYIYTGKQRHSLYHGSVAWLKPCAHQQQCQSNSVKCYKSNDSFDKVETNWTCRPTICFDFVERTKFYDKLVRHCSQQQSRMMLRQSRTLLRQCCLLLELASTLLQVWTGLKSAKSETKSNDASTKSKSSEETVQAKVRGGSPEGRSETTGSRICERRKF